MWHQGDGRIFQRHIPRSLLAQVGGSAIAKPHQEEESMVSMDLCRQEVASNQRSVGANACMGAVMICQAYGWCGETICASTNSQSNRPRKDMILLL